MTVKSNIKAELLRVEGNELYKQKRFFDALLKYNESLCNAKPGSEQIGLVYANRSAIYYEMEMYEKCLKNIKLACENNFPQRYYESFKKREEKCLKKNLKLRRGNCPEEQSKISKLSYPPNKKLPFIADCLELKVCPKYGRYIITNRQLQTGDVIAIEKPTFKVMKADSRYNTCHESNRYERCANCLMDNLFDLIPCPNCCATMFCSTDCLKYAQERYHKYECPVIDELLTSGITQIVLRMFFEGLSLFNGSIAELEEFISQHEKKLPTIFDINTNDEKSKFLATTNLATVLNKNHSVFSYESIFMKHEKLKKMWTTHFVFIKKMLQRFIAIARYDVHSIGGWSLKASRAEKDAPENKTCTEHQQLIGNGCFLFSSLLNHSCAPNIRRPNIDDKIVMIVSRPIPRGGQLFDCYRANFNTVPTSERQEVLMQDYGFQCDCEACSGDWPQNKSLNSFNDDLLDFVWSLHSEIPNLDIDEIEEKLDECSEFVNTYNEKYPSAELVIVQECISQCLIAMTKPQIQFP